MPRRAIDVQMVVYFQKKSRGFASEAPPAFFSPPPLVPLLHTAVDTERDCMDEAAASAAVVDMAIDDRDEEGRAPVSTCDTVPEMNALQPIDGNTGAKGSPDPPLPVGLPRTTRGEPSLPIIPQHLTLACRGRPRR